MTNNLAKEIDKRFLVPSSLGSLSLTEIENLSIYFPFEEIHLGFSSKQQFNKFLNDEIVSKKQYLKIFEGKQAFHRVYLQYVLKRWIVQRDFRRMLSGLIFFDRKMPVLSYFLEFYYQLLNFEEMTSEKLYEEFIDIKPI